MELYIHYPFCKQKCRYCDFLSAPADAAFRSRYMDALYHEIILAGARYKDRSVETVFIGGGTPSLMRADQLKKLLDCLYENFHIQKDAEITIEANPGTVDELWLKTFVQNGGNRLSLGLQSAHDDELERLGRLHRFDDFLKSFKAARRAGLHNINVDLMSALPGQSLSSWEDSLKIVAALEPEHISAYSLIIEEGTVFGDVYGDENGCDACAHKTAGHVLPSWALPLPDEDTERDMYHRTEKILADCGYGRYEISNYARPGFACRHNIGYWQRCDYLGLGAGAASLMDGCRFKNASDAEIYTTFFTKMSAKENVFLHEDLEILSIEAAMEEFMFLGLRMIEGVSAENFFACFGRDMRIVYKDVINRFCAMGLLALQPGKDGSYLKLTKAGIDVSNSVLAEFLLN